MAKQDEIKLSPSTLNLFLECQQCFWLQYRRGIFRPEGYHATLLSKIDKEIKNYFDKFRGSLPPEIAKKVEGKLMEDLALLKKWRSTRQPGLIYYPEPEIRLAGALDDCLVLKKNKKLYYLPIDFKSRGQPPDEEIPVYSQNQLDCYGLLLEKNKYPIKGNGYLVYFILEKIQSNGLAKFEVQVVKVKLNPEQALKTVKEAIRVLRGPMPGPNLTCPYCKYRG